MRQVPLGNQARDPSSLLLSVVSAPLAKERLDGGRGRVSRIHSRYSFDRLTKRGQTKHVQVINPKHCLVSASTSSSPTDPSRPVREGYA